MGFKRRHAGRAFALVLLLAPSALPASTAADLLRNELCRWREAMGHEGRRDRAVVNKYGTFVLARTAAWTYCIDVTGNQIFRPTSALPHLIDALQVGKDGEGTALQDSPALRPAYVAAAMNLASALGCSSRRGWARVSPLREVVILGECGGQRRVQSARSLVRLEDEGGERYFQVTFMHDATPIRIDTNMHSAQARRIAGSLRPKAHGLMIPVADRTGIAMVTFFDPHEHRFEMNAFSYQGESFLTPGVRENPFGRDHFDLSRTHFVDREAYRGSEDYRRWCWHWWNMYGRVNAIRGNWSRQSRKWQQRDVAISHRCLKDYRLIGGEPKERKQVRLSDNKTHNVPHATGKVLEPKFYKDLETCHIALFFTHMGPLQGRLQLRRGLDVWCLLGTEESPLGRGRLRHLFLQGCAGLTCFKQRDVRLVLSEWMPALYVNGLRTVCGVDGMSVGLDRDGWRFFGRYNKGDAIADAWAFALLDECPSNSPVTLAYGRTRQEALANLADGRFAVQRTTPAWCAISIWRVCSPVTAPDRAR